MAEYNFLPHSWSHFNPVKVVFESVNEVSRFVKGTNILLVTTPGAVARGQVDQILKALTFHKVTLWDRVISNPNILDLDSASEQFAFTHFDCVIGLGGGSALDSAKILATTIANPGTFTLVELFRKGVRNKWSRRLPLLLIPTTSGSGSEVSPYATLWDQELHKKYSLWSDFVFPDVAIMDETLTLTMTDEITLFTGLDAISHALESFWNKKSTPISRLFAFEALRLSVKYLPNIIKNSKNIEIRKNLMMASMMAGFAISQTQTAIAHSISYPLTSHYGIPHGLACSFSLPYILRSNVEFISENKKQTVLFKELLSFLDGLSLCQKMAKYINIDECIKYQNEMNLPGRADNYRGVDLGGIGNILEQSLI